MEPAVLADLFILYLRMPGNLESFDISNSDSLVN
jgi:hypothetical protein